MRIVVPPLPPLERYDTEESLTEVNAGGGIIAAFKGESGRGVRVGFRYTRNYGATISGGVVVPVN